MRISGITLSVNPQQHTEVDKAFTVRFRLANNGKHSIYYPLCKATDAPAGEIFYRTSATPAWTPLSEDLQAGTAILPRFTASNLAWIAFGIQLRTMQDTAPISTLSDPYGTSR
jgi:hypothetical protein